MAVHMPPVGSMGTGELACGERLRGRAREGRGANGVIRRETEFIAAAGA